MADVQSKHNYIYIATGGTHSYQQLHFSASILDVFRLYSLLYKVTIQYTTCLLLMTRSRSQNFVA